MIRRVPLNEQSPGWMFSASLSLHILLFFLLMNAPLFRSTLHEATPYYVDLVTLPAPDPSPDAAASAPTSRKELTAPPSPKPAQKPAVVIPDKIVAKPSQPQADAALSEKTARQEARDFAERLAKLEHSSESRHKSAAIESLKKKVTPSLNSVNSSGSGSISGSDYASYIQSRLKDSFATTIVYRTRNPESSVHIYIDRQGKLIRSAMITPSKDKLFNDSIMRAIEKAKSDFPPPPNGKDFDKLYLFSPQEVLGK